MKLKIFEPNKEKTIFLKLEERGDGIEVVVCDSSTGTIITSGHLLQINNDGTISRARNVNKEIGFELNKKGQIKLDETMKPIIPQNKYPI